jgi:hypothetical protein
MENQQEGPSIQVIPEIKYSSCIGCKWYVKDLIKTGQMPVYRRGCLNPELPEKKSWETQKIKGRFIESYMWQEAPTPGWCPVLKNKNTQ